MTDEQLRDREAHVADKINDYTGIAGMNFIEIMLYLRHIRQQNEQIKGELEAKNKLLEQVLTNSSCSWTRSVVRPIVEQNARSAIESTEPLSEAEAEQ